MAEKEYIEREAVTNHIDFVVNNAPDTDYKKAAWGFGVFVSRLPAADVAPVKHGHWKRELMSPKIGLYGYICLNCNKLIYVGIGRYMTYCGNCGAKMDGGD